MVLVGYVIEKDEKAINYFDRFIEVFSSVRASPFGKKKLFDGLAHKIKVFDDRLVFVYSGKISVFGTLMYLSKIALLLLLAVMLFLGYNGLVPVVQLIVQIAFFVGLMVQGVYHYSYSKFGFWFGHLMSMRKEKFGVRNYKKKLLSNEEIVDCFLWDEYPLFKKELRVER